MQQESPGRPLCWTVSRAVTVTRKRLKTRTEIRSKTKNVAQILPMPTSFLLSFSVRFWYVGLSTSQYQKTHMCSMPSIFFNYVV